ncbi:hypothetical protein P389DRAFT_58452 [Cystobasidium minutum MCA 4210]|uniref:uncharacterized protein n=1 Tax=Cystobasidium minutum MCA 4210 TaxID=1397322 RepID=UPI0034CF9BE5|eukprot:jgi/Rhomi1/58452/CE58451_78
MAESNPYLAHWNDKPGSSNGGRMGNGTASSSKGSALDGFVPRQVNGAQTVKAMEHDINPFNGKPYSQRYKDIMKKRKDLPVFQQMDEFFQIFSKNQITVMVGETGSGKTTQ